MSRSTAAAGPRTSFIALVLSVLMLAALALHLHVVCQRTSDDSQEVVLSLTNDEIGDQALAEAPLQGEFFRSPVRVPVYPLFIAATYYALGERPLANLLFVQAFIGVAVVPLTYLLARRLTGFIPALVAAGIVALDDSLIWHARGVFAEVVYTPLLLVALLALLWAVQAPRLRHPAQGTVAAEEAAMTTGLSVATPLPVEPICPP